MARQSAFRFYLTFSCLWFSKVDKRHKELTVLIYNTVIDVDQPFCQNQSIIFLGWNHRGVYILSRDKLLTTKIKRKLSPAAHRRMRMDYHR